MSLQAVSLSLEKTAFYQDLHYQFLLIELTSEDRIITPSDLKSIDLPAGIDTTGGVVISGRAPIWLYGYLVHLLHPTAWLGSYDPRIGVVVISSHCKLVQPGQVIPVHPINGRLGEVKNLGVKENTLCPALMIVGPPNSGKSVLSHTLFNALLPQFPNIYLQRAHWDGEGNYLLELGKDATEEEIEVFKLRDRGKLTDRFYPYHADAILQLRRQKSLVMVDVGGMVQPEKVPILEACSHYLIISSQPEAVKAWHEFCHDRGNLTPVATILSSLENVTIIHKTSPFLEMTYGSFIMGQNTVLPDQLLQQVKGLIK
ncbi:CRISPR-associated protein Csx3 [Anabaena sp. FACHB-1237]|uniref:CRISPR-associated ring nuclease Crn3/Csx3 n=1 Tax=Anabaena sp. FACHB-1237 TaxID=2692769 RepID=UPI001680A93A|nr:CRISPR-associated ring nuclease Crn3/Csx3 [Anabaena sp. FACHB-1237]MBD2137697.1 CRISPR-associated protein Csx3 [Anabaena sp. FACHB-1237]